VSDASRDEDVLKEPAAAEVTSDGDLSAALVRSQADFANYKRRTEDLARTSAATAQGSLVADLLPVLDALDLARLHVTETDSQFVPVHRLLRTILTSAGLEPFAVPGDSFSPALHDAVEHDDSGTAPVSGNTPETSPQELIVTRVLRQGYYWRGGLLRPAMVAVGVPSG
jgi:molecular chaperone GrpE